MNWGLFKQLIILIVICFSAHQAIGQKANEKEQIVINLEEIQNSGKRVEVQRYTGYENLFFRYLTLPYDISANTSRQGRYFDIGYLVFLLFPIALLLITYKSKKLFYSTLGLILLYLVISFSFSFINIDGHGPMQNGSGAWINFKSTPEMTFVQSILFGIYNFSLVVSSIFRKLIESFSGESDYITYPILSLLFLLGIWSVRKEVTKRPILGIIVIISIVNGFLWLLLSGGIIWYGFIMIPLLYLICFKALSDEYISKLKAPLESLKYILSLPIIIWIVLAFAGRISNITQNSADPDNLGKSIVDPTLIFYTTGQHSREESKNMIYPNSQKAFEIINQNDELIYQVGTSTAFEIKNNPQRVSQDNILSTFFYILEKYRDKEVVIDVIKASEYKYIIVDLYTHTLDKTPEQSLRKKFQLFLNTLYNNKKVKLIATDRLLEVRSTNNEIFIINDLFGERYQKDNKISIKAAGSYAIYEIL